MDEQTKLMRELLQRWVAAADNGELDGVDVALLVESEEAIAAEDE